ncbi:MAG TPA: trigger factor, partial [Candidatus Paceibacterota bacterium]|nr:trigger factor [Candidatus Paceibacterota bacterium]
EDIEATREEIDQRIALLAAQHQMRPEKLRRQLEERDTIDNIADEIVRSKVLDFLQLHARIEELPAGSPAPE